MNTRPLVTAAATVLALSAAALADIIYVDDSASGASTGLTWADAHTNLTAGLAAADPGDEIRIGQGTYRPAEPDGDRNATYEILEAVTIVGGYAGVGAADPDHHDPAAFPTILSGDLNSDDTNNFANNTENVFHVVTIDAVGVMLQGLTIRDGRAEGTDPGAGVLVLDGAEVAIIDCRIENNAGSGHGVGIHAPAAIVDLDDCVIRKNRGNSAATIGVGAYLGPGSSVDGCTFVLNNLSNTGGALVASDCDITDSRFDRNASDRGGAIFGENLTIADCTFTDNAGFGGALNIGDAAISRCTFESNHSGGGSAIGTFEDDPVITIEDCVFRSNSGSTGTIKAWGTTTIIRCDFIANTTGANGLDSGAIHNVGKMYLALCRFNGNSAQRFGGAVSNLGTLRAVSCSFSGNTALEAGGAINNHGIGRIFNCTFAGNVCDANNGGGALYNADGRDLRVYNSILWNNRDGNSAGRDAQVYNDGGTLLLRSCIVQGMRRITLDPLANSGADPLFRDADGDDNIVGTDDDDLRLRMHSPARNTGRNEFLPPDVLDLDGDGNTAEPSSRDLNDRARIRHGTVDRGALES